MTGQTIILNSDWRRAQARKLVDGAPDGAVLNIRAAKRSNAQNALFWALVSQISRAKPQGRHLPPETWKALFMSAAGFQCTFEPSLDGTGVVPLGFRSSRLSKADFGTLIEAVYAFAAEHGVVLTDDPEPRTATR